MEEMQKILKRRKIQEIWQSEPQNEIETARKQAKDIRDCACNLKSQLIEDLQKQHDVLHRMKSNVCISLDQQKSKLRQQIIIIIINIISICK